MPGAEGAAATPRLVRTTRLEAFSDGVFAIAITLLVLDLVIEPSGTPWERAAGAWPFYLAYVVSFLTIGAAWLGHTAITDRLAAADFVLLKINLLLLLVVAVLPFPAPRGGEFQGRRRRAALRRDVRSCLPGDATPAAGVGRLRPAGAPLCVARGGRGRRADARATIDPGGRRQLHGRHPRRPARAGGRRRPVLRDRHRLGRAVVGAEAVGPRALRTSGPGRRPGWRRRAELDPGDEPTTVAARRGGRPESRHSTACLCRRPLGSACRSTLPRRRTRGRISTSCQLRAVVEKSPERYRSSHCWRSRTNPNGPTRRKSSVIIDPSVEVSPATSAAAQRSPSWRISSVVVIVVLL